jgi:hypothetical protein
MMASGAGGQEYIFGASARACVDKDDAPASESRLSAVACSRLPDSFRVVDAV